MNIEGAYSNLLKEVKTDDFYTKIDLTNRVNVYMCPNNHIMKTKDIDPGVTPFMIACNQCKEFSRSSFYRDVFPEIEPTMEWYRPSLEEFMLNQDNPFYDRDHLLKGGLMLRYVDSKEEVFKIATKGNDFYFHERTRPHDESVLTQEPKHRNGRYNPVNRKKNKAARKARKQNRR